MKWRRIAPDAALAHDARLATPVTDLPTHGGPPAGETWQAHNKEGFELFLEQISHHPPVAAFKMKSPLVEFAGTAEFGVAIVVAHRGFKQTNKGSRVLRFADGDEIEIVEMPTNLTKGTALQCAPLYAVSHHTTGDLTKDTALQRGSLCAVQQRCRCLLSHALCA